MALEFRHKLDRELTFNTASQEQSRLLKVIQHAAISKLSIDVSEVMVFDSAGLAFLIEAQRLGKKHHLEINIENMSKDMIALAEFCGVHELLE